MKKTIGKTILIIACVAVIIFLLLPFLETNSPQDGQIPGKKATPQIFTSNPLSELVNRIARFFGAKQTAPVPAQPLTAQQTNEQFGFPQGNEMIADARAAAENTGTAEGSAPVNPHRQAGFGNASYQNEEGDWVLIRQTAPDLGAPGMHEINTKDNAYESYIRQERAARFTPTASVKREKEVPDSKLARFFRPIKRFFGFADNERISPQSDIWAREESAQLASSQGIGRSRNGTGRSFSRGGNINIKEISDDGNTAVSRSGNERNSLLSFLDPQSTLNEVADFLANSKYPNPKNEKEQQAKEYYRQQRLEETTEYFSQRIQERLNRLAAGQQPEDELKNMLEAACTNIPPRPVKSSSCVIGEEIPSASASEIQAAKQQNAELFLQKTRQVLPPAPLTPVIGKATGIDVQINPEFDYPEYIKTMEVYQFMWQNESCRDTSCYWVANIQRNNTELSDSVEASGVTLKGDPLGKYEKVQQQFAQYKLSQLPENATEEEKQEALTQAANFPPPYILYTLDELKEIQAQNREAILKQDKFAGTALYAVSAPIAKQISEELDSPTFFYGITDDLINADTHPSFAERSTALTNNLADQIQFFQQVAKEIKQNAAQEVINAKTRSMAQELQKKIQQEKKEFDQNNGLGNTERGQ